MTYPPPSNKRTRNPDQRINCSYIDDNNVYQDLTCTFDRFCCIGSSINTCSLTQCSTTGTTGDQNNISPTLFWSILGGLFGAGIIFIVLMYLICKFRAPNSCLSEDHIHDADLFEEECHEINTVSHQQSRGHQPRFYIRRESFWKITRRKSTSTVCKQCEEKKRGKTENNSDTPKDETEMKNNITIIKNVAQQKNTKTKSILPLPEVG